MKKLILPSTIAAIVLIGCIIYIHNGKKQTTQINRDNRFGIDVSHHQGSINWDTLKKYHGDSLGFVYVKATEGKTYIDPKFQYNMAKANEAGFNIGAYHYFTMTSGAHEQFKNFSTQLNKTEFNLIPMVDVEIEYKPKKQLQDSIAMFMSLIEKHYGVTPLIYGTNRSINTSCAPRFNDHHYYIGRYGDNPPVVKGTKYTIWQYDEHGKLKGIPLDVDLCVFHPDYSMKDILMPSRILGIATKKVPSEMTLPTTWTDTIYDTCYTSHSFDERYTLFIGWTEEDKNYNQEYITEYGVNFVDERNSLFLFDNQDKSTVLLKTTSPDGNGMFLPKFDAKNEWIYYGKQDAVASTSLLRYNLKTQEEELLTYCDNYTYHSILPNGNILFQNVREEIIEYSPEYEDGDWFGFVFCDIEMTPAGVCVNKSQLYQLDNLSEDKNYAMGNIGFLAEEGLRKQWNDSLSQTDYFNEKGEFVGYTTNYIESYNGWRR